MNFSIIIPNLNGEKYLEDCLPSLLKSLTLIIKKSKFEIILVDNNSQDNSIKLFTKTVDKFDHKIIKNAKNFGFSPSINQGISASKYDWVILLNNDIVIAPDWFKKITKQIELNTDKYAVYCGTVLTKDKTKYESTGLDFDYRGKCKNINNGVPFLPSAPASQSTSVPIWGSSAAFVVYNKNILNKIGGFDSDFFAYEEDVDVALRLNLLGYKTLLVADALSYHLGGGTSRKMSNFRQIMDTKNWFYIIIKDYPLKKIRQNLPNIIIERFRNLSGLCKATPILLLPTVLLKSYGEVLIYLPKMLKKRAIFQKLYDYRD